MLVPSPSSNGTSFDVLMEGYIRVSQGLNLTLAALAESFPNGRDYLRADFEQARREHQGRYDAIRNLIFEVEGLMERLQEKEDARQATGR